LSLKQAKLEESIKKLDSSKADEKDMKMSMAEAEKSLSRLRKQADAISSSVKTLRKELNANSAEIKSFSGIIEKLQTDFSNLLAQTIVEERLVQELGSQRKIYQDMMSLITQKLEARINDIDEDISTLKKHIVSLAKSSKSTQSYKKSEPRTTTTKKPSVKQQTDNIQELDIKK
jgi:peptidoglycan hydrolase CwlO-like protein